MSKKDTKKNTMKVVKDDKKEITIDGKDQNDFGITADEALKKVNLSLQDVEDLKKYKLCLIHGDWNTTTGFGMVLKKLMEEWIKREDYLFFILGINDHSENEYDFNDRVYVFPALPNKDNDIHGRIKFLHKLSVLDVDTVFLLNDPEVLNSYVGEMHKIYKKKKKQGRKLFKSIAYFPIDSEIRKLDCNNLGRLDEIVTYTEYAKKNLDNVLPTAKDVKVIPHGIDEDDFYPLKVSEIYAYRKKIFGKDHEQKFIIGSVNRNSVRKDVGTLLIAFSQLRKLIPNAVLYLHMNPKDPSGLDISRACSRLNLNHGKDVVTPKDFSENKGFKIEELNLIYNSFDVFVTTTTAEGWGLTISEAMATQTPVICPMHTAIPEVVGSHSFGYYNFEERFFLKDYEKIRFASSPSVVAHRIYNVYQMMQKTGKSKSVFQKNLYEGKKLVVSRNWKDIAQKFMDMFV